MRCALLMLLATGCAPGSGLNGPRLPDPSAGSGICFEFNLLDGFEDGAEIQLAFDCFNQYGAFQPLAETVAYLTTSANVDAVIDASNGVLEADPAAALETLVRLFDAEADPIGGLLDIYTTAYDEDFFTPLLALELEASTAMVACEDSAQPLECSLPRFGRALLASDIPDRAQAVADALAVEPDEGQREEDLALLARMLRETSILGGQPRNQILELATFLLEGDPSPIAQLLPHIRYLLGDDMDGDGEPEPEDRQLLPVLVDHLAALYRDGTLQALPAQLETLLTTTVDGEAAGEGAPSILDALLDVAGDFSGSTDLLFEEFTLPGSSTPTTVLELVLDTLDDLYVNDADLAEMVATIEDMVNSSLCGGDASSELCGLMEDVLPPARAALETGIGDLLLPMSYALHRTVDFERLLAIFEDILALDLANQTAFLADYRSASGSVQQAIDALPVVVDLNLGRLNSTGEEAIALVEWAIEPWAISDDSGSAEVVPALIFTHFGLAILQPTNPEADLDWLLGTVGVLMEDEQSPLGAARLADVLDALDAALVSEAVDPLQTARELLDNQALWLAALRLGADAQLIDLLTPGPTRRGAPWYLYDLIERGLLQRMLDYLSGLLDMLVANGVIDTDTEA